MRPGRWLVLAAAMALGGGLLAACDSDSGNGSGAKEDEGGVMVPREEEQGTPVAVEVGETDGDMFMTVSPGSVPAGPTTFTVNNVGDFEHEMLVMQPGVPFDQMPVNDDGEVDESTMVGEHHEDHIPGGHMDTMTVDLEPGEYVLVCNISGHYERGMRAPFTVT